MASSIPDSDADAPAKHDVSFPLVEHRQYQHSLANELNVHLSLQIDAELAGPTKEPRRRKPLAEETEQFLLSLCPGYFAAKPSKYEVYSLLVVFVPLLLALCTHVMRDAVLGLLKAAISPIVSLLHAQTPPLTTFTSTCTALVPTITQEVIEYERPGSIMDALMALGRSYWVRIRPTILWAICINI